MPPIVEVDLESLPDSDTVPVGQYSLRIDSITEVKQDKNGDDFVGLTYSIVKGDYVNRKVVEPYVTLKKGSKLKRICKAAGYAKPRLTSTDELVGLELSAYVGRQTSDQYGDQNNVKTYIVPGESMGKKKK